MNYNIPEIFLPIRNFDWKEGDISNLEIIYCNSQQEKRHCNDK